MIILDLGPLQSALQQKQIEIELFAHEAVGRVATKLAERWREAVHKVPGIPPYMREDYSGSIDWGYDGDFTATVSAGSKYARQVEDGFPARDLKEMLNTSARVRISKQSKKYLIIPMRQNTPGATAHARAMSPAIYEKATHLSMSNITGAGMRQNAHGRLVVQNQYQWGRRLPAGLAPKLQPHHKTDPMAGMVRMDTSTGKSKSSAYLTFRVMSQDSAGWVIPAKPGLRLLRDVAEYTQRDAGQIMSDLLREM